MAKTCNNCGNKSITSISYVAHESEVNCLERIIKRQWIALILVICMLFTCFAGFVWYESQYETVESWEQNVEQNATQGVNNFFGGDYYGKTNN